MNQVKRDDVLGCLLSVIRWGAAGRGYCGDCGRMTQRRTLFQPLVGTPPRNAPATTAAADAFLRAAMTMQRAGRLPDRAHACPVCLLCMDCALRRCEHFVPRAGTLRGDLGPLLNAHAALYSALLYVAEPGASERNWWMLINGIGSAPPPPHELLPLSLWLWRTRERSRSA